MGFNAYMDQDTRDDGDQRLGDLDNRATPGGGIEQHTKKAVYREKLSQRSADDLKLLKENYQKHIQTLSEELIILLQDRIEMKEEVDMRKISLEQFIRIQQFTPNDIETILGTHNKRHSVPANTSEQFCFDYVLKLSQTECSNKPCGATKTWGNPHSTNTDDVIHIIDQKQQQKIPSPENAQYYKRNRCRSVSVTRLCDNDVFKMDKTTKRYSLREPPCSVRDRSFFHTQIT